MSTRYGAPWSRDELVLALYLYCQVPFARTKANNPEVIRLATLLGRTPSSVARKLGNFGAFDPRLASLGIKGLTHVGRADEAVWREFDGRWEALVGEAQALLASADVEPAASAEADVAPVVAGPSGATERAAETTVRLYQAFFRRAVLASYEYCCTVCGIDLPTLLIASHIVPWSVSEAHRTDPDNGLCLCTLHDRAFDRGLMAVGEALQVLVSPAARASRSPFCHAALGAFAGQPIRLPTRFPPKAQHLEWHRETVFRQ
jgi:hypothetical protein